MIARAASAAACVAALLVSTRALADGDGVYGRLDGDIDLRGGAGVSFASGGPSLAASATIVYLETGGAYVHYADALGTSGPLSRRSISTGVHLQPTFLARYASNAERGPARLDLLIDSFAIQLGAVWQATQSSSFDDPGLELGVSIGLPILPRASGPFIDICGALRWRDGDLRGPNGDDAFHRGAMLSIVLSWHQVVPLHLVDLGDTVRR